MANIKLLESFDSGSNYRFGDKMNRASNPRSLFDLGFSNTLTVPNGGMLIPVGLFETLPGDDINVSVTSLLRVMPQVVPLMSRQRLYIYGFWSRYTDLWNNWQVFIDRGYTGNVDKRIPILQRGKNVAFIDSGVGDNLIAADSNEDYLGLPIGADYRSLFGTEADPTANAGISAMAHMMLLRVYRDYFMNKDEWINDRVMLPDDDSRFRLDDDGQLLSAKDLGDKFFFIDSVHNDDITIIEAEHNQYSMGTLYHDYPDDYFTSAKPFTQRGSTPSINKEIDTSKLGVDFSDAVDEWSTTSPLEHATVMTQHINAELASSMLTANYQGSDRSEALTRALAKGKVTGSNVGIQITLEDIRKVAIEQIELERMASCDGSYAQFGLTFFGEVSKAAHDFRATFFGGVYKEITFTEVVQNSPATGDSSGQDTPLGTFAGHGSAGMSNNFLGSLHCDDYGMVMLIACIMPDVYYHKGLKRIFTDSLESDKFKPDRAKLGMQPILNKELYYAGNNGNDSGEDNYLWAYQNPFDWLRYNQNEIHGKIADSANESFYPFTQARKFTELVPWGRNFSEAKDVRKDYLAGGTSEDAYIMQTKFDIRCVRELPYKAIPATII